jgi:hypothetical protein
MTKHAPAKHKPEPIDDMADALRNMVIAAETNGGRDHPEVVAARELLAKHEKAAK